MGMVFGKITVETPKYKLLHKTLDYEIRIYPPCVVAQTTYDPSKHNNNRDAGFMILANYIGALGNPQNAKPEKVAMTAPVITTTASIPEKIAMTAPVITRGAREVTMGFVLPAKYTKAEEAPRPLDERVEIREIGERKYGVVRFNGVAGEEEVRERVERLKMSLERDGYKIVGEYQLARYNPPWTLPYLRTNEVECHCKVLAKVYTCRKEGPHKGKKLYGCPKFPHSGCGFFEPKDDMMRHFEKQEQCPYIKNQKTKTLQLL